MFNVFNLGYADSKNVILLIMTVFFGYEAALVTLASIILVNFSLETFNVISLVIQMASAVVFGILLKKYIDAKGKGVLNTTLPLIYICFLAIGYIAVIVGGENERFVSILGIELALSIVASFITLFAMFQLFFAEVERRESKLELEANQVKLISANEELTALEEELRMQVNLLSKTYDDVVRQEHINQLLLRAGNESLWNLNLGTGKFEASQGIGKKLNKPVKSLDDLTDYLTSNVLPEYIENIRIALEDIKRGSENRIVDFKELIDGRIYWKRVKLVAMRDRRNDLMNIAGSYADITNKKEYEEKLKHLANYDVLTGLPNRYYMFEKHVNTDFSNENRKIALLYIDLDNFKNINDTMGHSTGDILLKDIGQRFQSIDLEGGFVSRVGGDEFVIIVYEANESKIIHYISLIQQMLEKEFVINYTEYRVSCSIGVAMSPQDGRTIEELMRAADIAMYSTKAKGKNGYLFFDTNLLDRYIEKLNMEKLLREGIENNEMGAFFQPKYNQERQVVGFEALARWNSNLLGMVPPIKFIPLAEQLGMIRLIRQKVLHDSCVFLSQLDKELPKSFEISINISAIELVDEDFIHSILHIIEDTKVEPKYIGIEITESALIESFELTCEKLNCLRAAGIKISLDDFGTGYSSLNYLTSIPADLVKFDKSFIDKILIDDKHLVLLKTIIWLAHYLNIETVAEGVETIEQFNALKALECDYYQGYLFSKPLPMAEGIKLVSS